MQKINIKKIRNHLSDRIKNIIFEILGWKFKEQLFPQSSSFKKRDERKEILNKLLNTGLYKIFPVARKVKLFIPKPENKRQKQTFARWGKIIRGIIWSARLLTWFGGYTPAFSNQNLSPLTSKFIPRGISSRVIPRKGSLRFIY